jgi:hypothetical protein
MWSMTANHYIQEAIQTSITKPWLSIELGHIDIHVCIAILAQYLAQPPKGHLDHTFYIFAHSKSHVEHALYLIPKFLPLVSTPSLKLTRQNSIRMPRKKSCQMNPSHIVTPSQWLVSLMLITLVIWLRFIPIWEY